MSNSSNSTKPFGKIEIPPFLSHLLIDAAGYPIPYTVYVDIHEEEDLGGISTPSYVVYNQARYTKCLRECRCGICGEPVLGVVYFIAGPEAELSLRFHDPPMHKECCEYAAATCPFMVLQDHPMRVGSLFIYIAKKYKVCERNDQVTLEIPALLMKKEIVSYGG